MARVLVIDDDEAYSVFLTTLLVRGGHEVFSLRNGRFLARLIAAEPFDAIITDLYMPETDGIEVLRCVKKLAPSAVVIAVTGGAVTGGARAARADDCVHRLMSVLGAAAVLTKPIDGDALLDILRAALDSPRTQERTGELRDDNGERSE